jgi:hypothetical protein
VRISSSLGFDPVDLTAPLGRDLFESPKPFASSAETFRVAIFSSGQLAICGAAPRPGVFVSGLCLFDSAEPEVKYYTLRLLPAPMTNLVSDSFSSS